MDRAASDDPWIGCMRRGEFEAAWRISDRLLQKRAGAVCWELPRHFQWIWDGTPLTGRRVLIRCYHGLGDTIQFIRYASMVRSIAAAVVVWAHPSLLPLLQTVDGIDELLALHDGAVDAEYDVDVESMELAHVFRTTIATIPAEIPYIRVPPATLRSPRPAVGIVWRAGGWDDRRSIPFAALAPLIDSPDLPVSWYVLQGAPGITERPRDFGIVAGTTDMMEAARVIASLDLLISVDTMAAHLAGALGAPVWTLLPRDADWRWMEDREDSPWYPTMRLYRQPREGDWQSVIERVAEDLGRYGSIRRPGASARQALGE
jgi:hypothetical protein